MSWSQLHWWLAIVDYTREAETPMIRAIKHNQIIMTK